MELGDCHLLEALVGDRPKDVLDGLVGGYDDLVDDVDDPVLGLDVLLGDLGVLHPKGAAPHLQTDGILLVQGHDGLLGQKEPRKCHLWGYLEDFFFLIFWRYLLFRGILLSFGGILVSLGEF